MMEQDDPILAKARELRKAGASIEQVKQYLQAKGYEVGQPSESGPTRERQTIRVPAAQSDMTRALPRDRTNVSGDFEADARGVAGLATSAAQVIPGMEAVQAKASSFANDMPYRDALKMQRSETDAIPAPVKFAMQAAVGIPLMAALPASPALAGAVLGGADQALDADPDRTLGERVVRGAGGAALGAGAGAAMDALITKGRALIAPATAKVVRRIKGERSAASGPLFQKAIIEGQGKTATDPSIAVFLAQPDVKEIITGLKQTRKFAGMSDDAPEMLDAVYKVLSDQGAAVKRGLESATPNKPNIGRFRGEDIRSAKDEALTAMDDAMPSYRPAVANYAEHSSKLDAVRRGQDAIRTASGRGVTSGKNLDRTTLEAFEDWAAKASPAQRKAALEGLLGATKQASSGSTPFRAARTLLNAPAYMRATKTPEQEAFDALIKATLIGGAATHSR